MRKASRSGMRRTMINSGTKAAQTAPVHSRGGKTAYSSKADTTAQTAAMVSSRLKVQFSLEGPFCHSPSRPQPSISRGNPRLVDQKTAPPTHHAAQNP